MANLDITKNFAKSTVSTGYNSSATEIVLVSGGGSVFPDPAIDGAFNLIWWDRSTFIDPFDDPNKEIVRCTAINGDTLTVIRAQEGTLATNKNTIGSWYDIALVLTKKTIDDIGTELDAKLEDITSESIGDLSDVDLTGVADGKILQYNGTSEKFEVSDAGTGDMEASTYDPTEVEGDAFDMDNMAQGTTNKFISAAELTVLQATSGTNTGDQEASDFDIKDLTDSTDLMSTWSGKQDALGYTAENSANKKTDLTDNSDTYYPTQKAVKTAVDLKQNILSEGAFVDGDKTLLDSALQNIESESIGDLSDVNDTGKATNKILKYNAVSGDWEIGDDNDTTYTASDFDIKDLTDSTDLRTTWSGKQDALVSGTNIKTINSTSLLGGGDIVISGGSGAVDWIAKSSAYTASNGDGILADTSSSAWTLTLPSSPSVGDVVGISDASGSFSTNNLTIAYNGSKIMGASENLVIDIDDASFLLVYTGSTDGWKLDTYMPVGSQLVKATNSEINTGTDDAKYATAKALADSKYVKSDETVTLTNKRITKRVSSTTSTSTLTPDSDAYDVVKLTAQAEALTIAAPTGTPTDGQALLIQILDNGTARALTWNAAYVAMGSALPITTTISKILQVGCIWDAGTSKWLASSIQQV